MTTTRLAIAFLLASSAFAHAEFTNTPRLPPPPQAQYSGGTYECAIVSQKPQPKRDDDPIYKINAIVGFQYSKFNSMSVVHTARSGRTYDRSTQYTINPVIWQTPDKTAWNWSGWNGRDGAHMLGTLFHNDRDGWMYRETISVGGGVDVAGAHERDVYTMLAGLPRR